MILQYAEHVNTVFVTLNTTEKPPYLLNNGILITIAAEATLLLAILLGNGFVALVLMRSPIIQCDQCCLITSLAISDILSGLSILFVLVTLIEQKFALTICKWRFTTLVIWWMASLYTLLTITLNRFIAIIKPFCHRKIITKNVLFVALMVIWLHSLIVGFLTFKKFDFKSLRYCDLLFNVPRVYMKYFVWNFFIVLLIITICYIKIFLVARNQARKTLPKSTSFILWLHVMKHLKYVRTLILVIGALLLCWVPLIIVLTLELNYGDSIKLQTARLVACFMSQSGSLFNPLVYSYRNSEFCAAAKKLCCKQKNSEVQIQVVSTINS